MSTYQLLRTLALTLALGVLALGQIAARQAPPADPVSQEEQGAELFQQNCAVCHGPTGEGRVGATLAKDWPSIRPDLTVRTIIENGVPGTVMPAWSQANGGPLSEAEIDALVAYILSWQTGGAPQITPGPTATRRPPITPPPSVEGDPNNGAILFDENCIACHGANGEGRIGATLAKDWPSIRPDLTVKATITDGVPGSQMPAWSQAKGGPLSEEEINDLVAYILTLGEQTSVAQISPTQTPKSGLSPFWSGWGGVIAFVLLLAAIIALALWVQRRKQA